MHLDEELTGRVMAHYPLPVADAFGALAAAQNPNQQRDLLVEAFRACIRYVGAAALAARLQFGPGPKPQSREAARLLQKLRGRGLTDGEWVGLARELVKPWRGAADEHALPELVRLMCKDKVVARRIDTMLALRKQATVAHGTTGSEFEARDSLHQHLPVFEELLRKLEPLFCQTRLLVPQERIAEDRQQARLLMGCTPPRRWWRSVTLAEGERRPHGEVLLADTKGRPSIAFDPVALFRAPSPGAPEELFLFDGSRRGKGARYVAFPSMASHRRAELPEALDEVLRIDADEEADEADASGGRPYRGLASFRPEHAELFYGREELVEQLVNQVLAQPFVTVTGPSGSGKTSLLEAGLVAAFRRRDELDGDHPYRASLPGSGNFSFTAIRARPGAEPLSALVRQLHQETGGAVEEEIDPSELAVTVERWARNAGTVAVVIIDQAEELFTLCDDGAQRETFAECLAELGASAQAPTRAVLSLRGDFFDRVAALPALRRLYARNVLPVTTPGPDTLARTLVEPLDGFGYSFEEPELVEEMVEAVADEPAALALLQFTADCLWDGRDRSWKRLTRKAYEDLGGIEGALARHADRVVDALSPTQQRAARAILQRLVTAQGTRAAASRAELVEASPASSVDSEAALHQLVDARLLTAHQVAERTEADGENGSDDLTGATFEIVHEALLSNWGRLEGWLAEDRDGQRVLQGLRTAAQQWQDREKPADLLYRGDLLGELQAWRGRTQPHLTRLEAEFADASAAVAKQAARAKLGGLVAALTIVSLFSVFMAVAWRGQVLAREQAEETQAQLVLEKTRAETRQLLAEARGFIAEARRFEAAGKHPEALALLRAAGRNEAGDEAAREARRAGIGVQAGRMQPRVLVGSPHVIHAAAFSPDGKRLATASEDRSVHLWATSTGELQQTLEGHQLPIYRLLFAPDGKRLVTFSFDLDLLDDASEGELGGPAPPPPQSGKVLLWNLTGDVVRPQAVEVPQALHESLAFSRDGTRLALTSGTGKRPVVHVVDTTKVAVITDIPSPFDVEELAFSNDGAKLTARAEDGRTQLWSSSTGDLIAELPPATGATVRHGLSTDGARLASASETGSVVVRDVEANATAATFEVGRPVQALRFSPDGKRLAVAIEDRGAELWHVSDGHRDCTVDAPNIDGSTLAFSKSGETVVAELLDASTQLWQAPTCARLHGITHPFEHAVSSGDNRQLATWGEREGVRLWELDGGDMLHSYDHRLVVIDATLSPDGSLLATSTQDGTVRLWDVKGRRLARTLSGHGGTVGVLAFSPDGTRLAGTKRLAPVLFLWDVETGRLAETLETTPGNGGADVYPTLAFTFDGGRLCWTTPWGRAEIWDPRSGERLHSLEGHEDISTTDVSPDGATLATGSEDGRARLWSIETGELRRALEGHGGSLYRVAFSPDGEQLATASEDETARLWEVSTGRLIRTFEGHSHRVLDAAFSPDGQTLTTAAADRTARIWAVNSGRLAHTLEGHRSELIQVRYSPDGGRLATASQDGTACVWEVETGAMLQRLEGHLSLVTKAAFLPSGTRLITTGLDRTVRLWDVTPRSVSEVVERSGGRTNLRVCRDTSTVVPVLPFPPDATVWAPEEACPFEPE